MGKRSIKSANGQIRRIDEMYPNHRLTQAATKSYLNRIDRIAKIIGITIHTASAANGGYKWYDHDEFYANWDTEVFI